MTETSLRSRLVLLAILLSGVAASGSVCVAEDSSARYFEQLRRRGLLRLAEGICRRELQTEDLSAERRSHLTLELSRTIAEQAKYATGKEQSELWGQATEVLDKILKSSTRPPRPEWLELQRAVVLVLQGEFLRWDAELAPYDDAARESAKAKLSEAVAALQSLEQLFAGKTAPKGERAELQRHVRYQLAIAWVNKAALYPPDSVSRRTIAATAGKIIAPLTAGTNADAMTWNSRLLRAIASRLQGDFEQAADRLAALERLKPPVAIVDRTIAERSRLLLQQNSPDAAQKMLDAYRKLRGGMPGELAYLKVRITISQWNAARKSGEADRATALLKQAKSAVAEAEQNVGGYWSYRCRVLLDYSKDAGLHGPKLAAALRKAQIAYRNKDLAKAAENYALAAKAAEKSGEEKTIVDLLYTAGSVQMQAGQFDVAATTLQRLADDFPKHEKAASAHLLAAYSLGRHYDARRTAARRLAYTQALQTHLKRFAADKTVHDAAWMLALLYEYRRQTTKSLELYLSIPADHPRGLDAQTAAARCYEEIIDRLREMKKPPERKAWETHAVIQLGKFVKHFPAAPALINQQQAEIALRTARIHLNRSPPGYKTANALLERVLTAGQAAAVKTPPGKTEQTFWTSAVRNAQQMRVVALAGAGKYEEARSLVAALSQTGAAEVLAVLDGLMKLGSDGDATVRQQLGALQLEAAQELNRRRDKLKPQERAWLDRCLAQAYSATGRGNQAVSLYEEQLAKNPRNKSLLKTTAELLMKDGDRKSLLKSKAHWRKLESLEKTGSVAWLTARYHVALCSSRLAEYDDARKLVRLTKLLYPKLGNEEMRKQFATLEADLQKTR